MKLRKTRRRKTIGSAFADLAQDSLGLSMSEVIEQLTSHGDAPNGNGRRFGPELMDSRPHLSDRPRVEREG